MAVYEDIVECLQQDPNLLDKVIIGDKMWIVQHDPEPKEAQTEWHTKLSPKLKKAHIRNVHVKVLLIVFF